MRARDVNGGFFGEGATDTSGNGQLLLPAHSAGYLIVAYFMLSGGTDRSGCDCVTDAEESRRSPLPLHLFPTFKL
jgi:hypothetical protein